MSTQRRRERDPIGSTVRLLGELAEAGGRPVGVRELARALALSPSTVQRTLEAARDSSVVSSTPDGKWRIGWEVFRLGAQVARQNPFLGCQDLLDTLRDDLAETTVLTVLDTDKNQRMFAASSESERPVRFVPDLFTWLPALAGATGMAIVAHLTDEERSRVHDETPSDDRPATIRQLPDFEESCRRIRDQGHAISENEVDLGACSIAVPVQAGPALNCAVGVIVPQQRFEAPTTATLDLLHVCADEIARRLGGRGRSRTGEGT